MENQHLLSQDNPCQQKSTSDRKFVIFDLDGTLIDSFECVLRCVNKALDSFSLPNVEIPLSERQGDIAIIFDKAKDIINGNIDFHCFKKRFDKIHYDDCIESVNVVPKTLTNLKDHFDNGVKLVIITNKFQSIAERICYHFFKQFNISIIGRLDCSPIKSDSNFVAELLQKNGLDPIDCLCYYGDTNTDELLSELMNIKFINVSDV